MNEKRALLSVLFVSMFLFCFTGQSNLVQARFDPPTFQIITPENIGSMKLITSLGQGLFTGLISLQPNGKLLAAGTPSGIALVDLETGIQTTFIQTGFNATALTISPDGQMLAAVFNVPTGKLTTSSILNGPEYQRQIAFYSLPDGNLKGAKITDLQECGNSNIWQMAFLPDGNSLIFEKKYGNPGEQKKVCVLSLLTQKITDTLDIPDKAASTIAPDGRYVAIVQRNQDDVSDTANIFDTLTLNRVHDITFSPVKWPEISFTRKGVFVLRFFEGETETAPHQIRFWSLPEGNPLLTLQENEQYSAPTFPGRPEAKTYDRIMSEDFSPDGQWVVTGSQNGKVKLWDAQTGQLKKELGVLTWKSHNQVENPDGNAVFVMNSYVNPVLFTTDGKTVLAVEDMTTQGQTGQIHIYEMPDGNEKVAFSGDAVGGEDTGLAFSPDGNQIAVGGFSDGRAEIHRVPDGELVFRLTGHTAPVNQIQYSPDGAWIATTSDDQTIRLWDARNGQPSIILTGHTARITQIAFSPDGLWLVSGADDNSIRRWNLADGRQQEILSLGDENWRIEFLGVLKDNRSVVYTALKYPSPLTGYIYKQSLWDFTNGKESSIGGGKVTISSLNADGDTFVGNNEKGLAVGRLDSSGKMTLLASSIRSPYGNGALAGRILSPDNRLLISGNGFGLQAWELTGTSAKFLTIFAAGEPIPSYGNLFAMSPDGKILAFADGGVVYLLGVPVR